jgi:hypothetical protein
LAYRLNAAATKEFQFAPLGEVRLGVDPCQYLQGTFDTLSDIAKKAPEDRTPAETERCLQEFIDIGVGLYRDLFSPELKDAYRRLRGRDEYRTLVIISDEPWIPWEMVKPVEFDENGTLVFRDGHLCETFQLARWVSTGRTTPDKVPVKAGALVLPPANLQNAQVEADYFVKLHQQEWEVVAQPPLASVSDVEASFRDGTKELFHFACHGNFESPTPDTSKLELSDGFLTPGQIVDDKEAGLRRSRPLVFLNACYAGRTGFSLTQIGGWAQRFIDAGVSAFIGSLWEINDRLAARFAVEFYNRLWGLNGQQKLPLGEAVRQARLVIKEADPANPTWLAYVLYGDPLAEVDLGG